MHRRLLFFLFFLALGVSVAAAPPARKHPVALKLRMMRVDRPLQNPDGEPHQGYKEKPAVPPTAQRWCTVPTSQSAAVTLMRGGAVQTRFNQICMDLWETGDGDRSPLLLNWAFEVQQSENHHGDDPRMHVQLSMQFYDKVHRNSNIGPEIYLGGFYRECASPVGYGWISQYFNTTPLHILQNSDHGVLVLAYYPDRPGHDC